MDESTIIWKEAKSRKHRVSIRRKSLDQNEESPMETIPSDPDQRAENEDIDYDDDDSWGEPKEDLRSEVKTDLKDESDILIESQSRNLFSVERTFSHKDISLRLRRKITALTDSSHHKARFSQDPSQEGKLTLAKWIENALVAISPSADMILFSGSSPEKVVFLAKLHLEPIDEYTTKALDIPIEYDEQITSLLCLPIMSTQRTSLGSVDWTALVVGLSSGYVKFYTEQSICLLSLKFCDESVTSLKVQTQKHNSNARSQLHFASIVDELLITYKSCAIVIDGIGLHENLRISKGDVVKNGSCDYEPAYTLTNLPIILTCQKWKIDNSSGSRVLDAELLGTRCTSRFDALRVSSINSEHTPTKSCTRSIVMVGSDPFVLCRREAKDNTVHSYREIITSLLPSWSKTQPTRYQVNEITPSTDLCLFDRGRLATSIVASPDRRLAATTDDFGRVMLIDVTNWIVVRIWKGYRNAQCGWVEVKRDQCEKNTPHASFLVIYAPRRGLLEVWSSQRGPRVAAFNVGKHCQLLYSGYKMLNMRAEASTRGSAGIAFGSLVDQSYSTNCYLLNALSETVFAIELPYTYSLYKYGDLKSRDHLLIGELTAAMNQGAEVSLFSEILDRVALAESLEICMHKLVFELQPAKIVPIMENLILKIMKNYDNDAGETMTNDDASIVELGKRIIRLCVMFQDLSSKPVQHFDLSLPDVNQRLIQQYHDHPKEVDEFAEQLGWTAAEVLRYLSLLTLEQSYKKSSSTSSFGQALLGEPLSWQDFVSCFDIDRLQYKTSQTQVSDELTLRLKDLSSKFLNEDRVIKTASFLYAGLSGHYHKWKIVGQLESSKPNEDSKIDPSNYYNHIEAPSRLALLLQFWLSTKTCNHWKMWAFLQDQVGRISDELKMTIMAQDGDDKLLIETWKRIYQIILESDNVFAALVATTAIKSDTLRMLSDKQKSEKLSSGTANDDDEQASSAIDWECLCIDAERMSLLGQQLADVFLLSLLLNYSHAERRVVERAFVYRVPRISVANVLRGGPSTVSELVAQWAAHITCNGHLDLSIFTQNYGTLTAAASSSSQDAQIARVSMASALNPDESGAKSAKGQQQKLAAKLNFLPRSSMMAVSDCDDANSGDHQARELLHHVKTSFPHSLDSDVILLHCLWEFCQRWTNGSLASSHKSLLLQRAIESISLLSCALLRHNAACLAFKNFFQRTFERLCLLIEKNATILSPKCSRSRDALARRELNMGEDCLEDFVRFCCNLSEFLLQTCQDEPPTADSSAVEPAREATTLSNEQQLQRRQTGAQNKEESKEQLYERLLCQDDWWSTLAASESVLAANERAAAEYSAFDLQLEQEDKEVAGGAISADYYLLSSAATAAAAASTAASGNNGTASTLVRATLSIEKLFSVTVLLELNRLASLMDLIFKLKIIKSYPLTLIGEQSRQTFKLDLQQSPATSTEIQLRSGSLPELRQKFVRRCIVCIVAKLTEELPSMASEFEDVDSDAAHQQQRQLASEVVPEASSPSGNSLFTCRRRRQQLRQKRPGRSVDNSQSVKSALGRMRIAGSQADDRAPDDDDYDDGSGGGGTSEQPLEGDKAWSRDRNRDGSSSNGKCDSEELEQEHFRVALEQQANSECTLLFANLLSLSNEWQLNCDELQLEFVFELFRCNHDKLAKQLIIRVQDKQMLASGLLKICSQRVLALFGLSARLSSTNQWRQRVDKWSLFQPNVSSWLKSIQAEELEQELAELNFSSPGNELKSDGRNSASPDEDESEEEDDHKEERTQEAFTAHMERELGLRMFVLQALHWKTKSVLELVTNYLDGQACRLAYDLLQVLEVRLFDEQFLPLERKLWREQRAARSKSKR